MSLSVRIALPCAMLLFAGASVPAAGAAAPTVTVMTQNMDAGTDLGFALAYLGTSTPQIGIDLTYREILKSDFAGRAAILAREIAAAKPDLVSLQEVTVWTAGQDVLCDQLQLLQDALAEIGESYAVAGQNDLTSIALPMSDGVMLGFQDHDVILVRNGSGVTVGPAQPAKFAYNLNVGGIQVLQGWMSAPITKAGRTFTLVDTHLLTAVPGQPGTYDLQTAQAVELASVFGGTAPVVIAGDFNSNATHTPPEQTAAIGFMLGAGFTDSWRALHPGNPGFTWPLYVEDPYAPHPNGPFERIDFVFERGLSAQSVDRIGWKAPHASDHAGVVATLALPD